jgi:hypothetical protein
MRCFSAPLGITRARPCIPSGVHRGVQLSANVSRTGAIAGVLTLAFGERSKPDQVRKSYGSLFCVRLSQGGRERALRGPSPSPLDAAMFSKHAPRWLRGIVAGRRFTLEVAYSHSLTDRHEALALSRPPSSDVPLL